MSESEIVSRDPRHAPTGVEAVIVAFKRAFLTQCHPKMLGALLLPFVVALLGAIILLWAFWSPLTNWLVAETANWDMVNYVDQWLVGIGLFSIKVYMVSIMAAGILLPMSGILGLIIAAVVVMPLVLKHIEKREYIGLKRQGQMPTAVSGWNAIWVGLLFVVGWLLTMPLWLVPPLAVLLPIFWWAFAFTRMLSVDAIVEHASSEERRLIWKRHKRQLWLIGGVLALINLFPPAWLVLPVFSALVFAHFSLEALRQLRAQRVIDV
ncbi:EI24 domain-containing protein [Pusillimonas sp. ANT_WB101]|uniref:EI24 domain-containing protein n=1 Tax=Pusillimonas sp. ANT_WB101 TaxID=2597356 RepID=UPI0011EC17D0|nr:EI24 domain-containing protein [Pusillimonas sp. ANT_WB101]KAA0890049.1 EI24 domain-containing protein [Pusillimonas sp. ANT_WB101]NYT76414.1 EI24 domain-containing protein [Alcaligenaceae bacterium]